MESAVRLGVVGAGAVVAGFHLPTLSALPQVRVAWLYDVDRERASTMARRFGVSTVAPSLPDAPDVDMVLVATPVGARMDVMKDVTARRWHAFCEKPFASSPDEHERILALAAGASRRAGIGLVRRFYASTRTAREVVAAELLGPVEEILAGEGLRARKFGRGEWFHGDAKSSGGGVFAETGTHLIDQVFSIAGVSHAELHEARQERIRGLEMDTRIKATLTLGGGAKVPLTLGVSRLHDLYNGIVVRCRHGEVRLATDPEAGVDLIDKRGRKVGSLPGTPKPGIFAAIRAEWLDFIRTCRDPHAPPTDTGLATTRLVAQAYGRAQVISRGSQEQEMFQ